MFCAFVHTQEKYLEVSKATLQHGQARNVTRLTEHHFDQHRAWRRPHRFHHDTIVMSLQVDQICAVS
jgi:hypothetical protein